LNSLTHIVKILSIFFKKRDLNLKLILSNYLKNNQNADSGKVTNSVYGIVRNELTLIYIIEKNSKQKFSSYTITTKILLLTGVYLLLFSSSYPDHAVVNEIVNAAKGEKKSFINAMLRSVAREKPDTLILKNRIKSLNIRFSGTSFYIKKVTEFQKDAIPILEYLDKEPVFHIKPNLGKISYESALNILKDSKIEFKEIRELKTFEIKKAGKVISDFVSKGIFYFQNSGSQLVSIITAHFSGKKIIDCCSAPGTKSITLHFFKPKIRIVANDISFKRIKLMKNFMKSFDISEISLVTSNILESSFLTTFDLYLIDAPCSSSGTIRKNPDLKLKFRKEKITQNSKLQKTILESIIRNAHKGSTIVYSVCSFVDDESEKVVRDVLKTFEKRFFSIFDIGDIAKKLGFKIHHGNYGIFLLPSDKLNNDLFYISAIKVL